MEKVEWHRLIQNQDRPVEIDISDTPLAALGGDAEVVGSFAERTIEGKGLITIFRNDPKDAPKNINVYKHEVWENVYLRPDYEQTVKGCNTLDDSMLRSFLNDYVFLVPIKKRPDHHLSEMDVPAIYKAILKGKKAPVNTGQRTTAPPSKPAQSS